MPSIYELQQSLAQRQEQLQQAKQQLQEQKGSVEKFVPKIMQSGRQLLQATPLSQTRLQQTERLREEAKRLASKQISEYEEQVSQEEAGLKQAEEELSGYLKTPSGIFQYAQEMGIKPTIEMRGVGWGKGNYEEAPVKIYKTPYGTFEDTSEFDKLRNKVGFQTEALSLGGKNKVDITKFMSKYGLTGATAGQAIEGIYSEEKFREQLPNIVYELNKQARDLNINFDTSKALRDRSYLNKVAGQVEDKFNQQLLSEMQKGQMIARAKTGEIFSVSPKQYPSLIEQVFTPLKTEYQVNYLGAQELPKISQKVNQSNITPRMHFLTEEGMKEAEKRYVFNEISGNPIGFASGNEIYIQTGTGKEKSTMFHELGHFYSPNVKDLSESELKSVSKEGEFVLRLKYRKYPNLKEAGYIKEDYPREAFAIAKGMLIQGGIKAKIAKTFMPSTTKVLEKYSEKQFNENKVNFEFAPSPNSINIENLKQFPVTPSIIKSSLPYTPTTEQEAGVLKANTPKTSMINPFNVADTILSKSYYGWRGLLTGEAPPGMQPRFSGFKGAISIIPTTIRSSFEPPAQEALKLPTKYTTPLIPERIRIISPQTYNIPQRATYYPGGEFRITTPETILTRKQIETGLGMAAGGIALFTPIGQLAMATASPLFQYQGAKVALSPEETITRRIAGGAIAIAPIAKYAYGKIPKGEISVFRTTYTAGDKLKSKYMQFQKPQLLETAKTVEGEEIAKSTYAIKGKGIFFKEGGKTEVYYQSPFRKIFNKPAKLLSREEAIKLLVEGGKTARGAIIKFTPYQAKNILRTTMPKVTSTSFKGLGEIVGEDILIRGKFTEKPKIISFDSGRLRTRTFTPSVTYVEQPGISLGEKVPSSLMKKFKLTGGKLGESEYYYSMPTFERRLLTKEGKEYMKISQAGKTKQTFEQLSAAKKTGEGMFPIAVKKGGGLEIFEPAEYYKEISLSKSFIPAGRKVVPSIKSRVVSFQTEPIRISREAPFTIEKIPPKIVKRLPSEISFTAKETKAISKTLRDIYGKRVKTVQIQTKVPKLSPALPQTSKTSMISKSAIDKIVSRSESAYAGKGLYELTEGGVSPIKAVRGVSKFESLAIREVVPQKLEPKIKSVEIQEPRLKEISRLTPELRIRMTERLEQNVTPEFRTQLNERIVSKPLERMTTRLTSQLKIGLSERLKTAQFNNLRFRTPQLTTPRTSQIITPKIPSKTPPIKIKSMREEEKQLRKIRVPKKLFIPEVRRRGKFIPISQPTTYQRALSLGISRVKTTLGASLRIRGEKGFVSIPISKEFRTAKRNPFIVIQRKERRLSSPFEVREIISARKGGILS